MHITSLSNRYGIGDLGPGAYDWVDTLEDIGCAYWQILPTGPTGYANSPYQCLSSIAGNPLMISPELLLRDQILNEQDLNYLPDFPESIVDFPNLMSWKNSLLRVAFDNFQIGTYLKKEFDEFKHEEQDWLNEFALYMSLKEHFALDPWVLWPRGFRDRLPGYIDKHIFENKKEIEKHKFLQFLFFRQWDELKAYAEEKEIKIIGDLPIYVAHDSVDVWVNRPLFKLAKDGNLEALSGVPPDFFSEDGQLWGNPIYKWEEHAKEGYEWWITRLSKLIKMVDVIRIDHFRGFAGFWEVPAGNETARIGEWLDAPGDELFSALQAAFGEMPFIAEDLGEITPDVIVLRDKFDLPGMRILQFAFGTDDEHPFLPHNYPEKCVSYSGTHDNKTLVDWYETAPKHEQERAMKYLRSFGEDYTWAMIRFLWQSKSMLVVVQTQDILGQGEEGRMNIPGTTEDNWIWRLKNNSVNNKLVEQLRKLNIQYNRKAIEF